MKNPFVRMGEVEIELGESGNEQPIPVRVGDDLLIGVQGIPSAGYLWEVTGADTGVQVTERAGETVAKGPPYLYGGTATHLFHVVVGLPGEHVVHLSYRRPWESDPPHKVCAVRLVATDQQ